MRSVTILTSTIRFLHIGRGGIDGSVVPFGRHQVHVRRVYRRECQDQQGDGLVLADGLRPICWIRWTSQQEAFDCIWSVSRAMPEGWIHVEDLHGDNDSSCDGALDKVRAELTISFPALTGQDNALELGVDVLCQAYIGYNNRGGCCGAIPGKWCCRHPH